MARSNQNGPRTAIGPRGGDHSSRSSGDCAAPGQAVRPLDPRTGDSQYRTRRPSQRVLGGADAALAALGAEALAAASFETVTGGRSALHLGWLRISTVKSAPKGIASRCRLRLRRPGSRYPRRRDDNTEYSYVHFHPMECRSVRMSLSYRL